MEELMYYMNRYLEYYMAIIVVTCFISFIILPSVFTIIVVWKEIIIPTIKEIIFRKN